MTRKQKQTRLAVIAGALLVAAVAVASRDMENHCIRCNIEPGHNSFHITENPRLSESEKSAAENFYRTNKALKIITD